MSVDQLIQAHEEKENKKKFNKVPYYVIKQFGRYRIRLLPNIHDPDSKIPYMKKFYHIRTNPNTKKNFPYKCGGKECEFCKEYNESSKTKGKDAVWRKKVIVSALYYMLDIDGNLRLIDLPATLHRELWSEIKESRIDVFSLDSGHYVDIIKIDENGKGKVKWKVRINADIHTVDIIGRSELEKAKPLKEILPKELSKEEMINVIKGIPSLKEKRKPEEVPNLPVENNDYVFKKDIEAKSEQKQTQPAHTQPVISSNKQVNNQSNDDIDFETIKADIFGK